MSRLAILLAIAGALRGQVTSTLDNGLAVHVNMKVEPPLKDGKVPSLWSGVQDGHDRVHRSVGDRTTKTIFGYDLFAEPVRGVRDQFLVRIEPLTKTMTEGRIVMLSKYPPPQTVREGDIIALDLLVSPDGGQKLVDYIEVGWKNGAPPTEPAQPRDFTLDDGPPRLQLETIVHCRINGRVLPDRVAFTMRPGATLWFALPGRGRYILSLSPQQGFQKAGTIRDHDLSFQSGPDTIEFRADGPILGSRQTWNLYVLHDPAYRVVGGMEGGVDRLDHLIRR
jgi:hypothetical protein